MSRRVRLPPAAASAVLSAALLAFVVPGPAAAQEMAGGTASVAEDESVREALAVVRTWLEAQQAYEQIPSHSAAVVHDQELVWSDASGMAHPDEGIEATPETLYSICSISKLFTSVSVMQLRDRGLVDLRDPVSDLLPHYAVEQRWEGSPPVTVEGILTHYAGLPRESAHPYWTGPDFPFPTREEVIEGLDEQETLYPARKYYQYSNLGLTLAGEIVEELSGMAYGDYVRTNVLEPLGMEDTYPEIPAEHRGGRLATGYSAFTREGTREEVAFFQAEGIAPAAGYASTARDLARFASWQFRLEGDTEEVLHAHTLDEMQRPHYVDPDFATFRGLGFGVMRRDDETFVGHGGSCPGFRSQLVLQRDEKIATVFMANAMVSAGTYAFGMYDLVAEAIRSATEDEDGASGDHDVDVGGEGAEAEGTEGMHAGDPGDEGPDLEPYLGTYSNQPWGSETAVVEWKEGLALMRLPTSNPLRSLTRLEHDEGDVFYRTWDDGERAEDVVFERDADGRVTGFRVHGNLSRRVR